MGDSSRRGAIQTVFVSLVPWLASDGRVSPLIGTPRAGIVVTAVVVGAEVDCLAAERAALVDERLILLDAHDSVSGLHAVGDAADQACLPVLKIIVKVGSGFLTCSAVRAREKTDEIDVYPHRRSQGIVILLVSSPKSTLYSFVPFQLLCYANLRKTHFVRNLDTWRTFGSVTSTRPHITIGPTMHIVRHAASSDQPACPVCVASDRIYLTSFIIRHSGQGQFSIASEIAEPILTGGSSIRTTSHVQWRFSLFYCHPKEQQSISDERLGPD
ncbi:hypothetical protein M434DRAFT_30695 [Hypoxylon sp. CO27-5]|nr:hypothetical protein M434DRAFT_30695 [Hypoxylon sp. CO27-5]